MAEESDILPFKRNADLPDIILSAHRSTGFVQRKANAFCWADSVFRKPENARHYGYLHEYCNLFGSGKFT